MHQERQELATARKNVHAGSYTNHVLREYNTVPGQYQGTRKV